MIEIRWCPGGCGMAGSTIQPKPPAMRVSLLMASITISRNALEVIIRVTALACYCGMFPGQLEGEQVMVHMGWQPPVCCMTDGTILSKSTGMFVVLMVA